MPAGSLNTMCCANRWVRLVMLVLAGGFLTGCHHVGPVSIVRDRFQYNEAIRDSWEEQMLTNMVSLRYGEAPVFLNVDSVIAQYGLETSAQVSAGLNTALTGEDTLQAGGRAVWSERPTITYTPVQGRDFALELLTPIEPAELFGLIEAGWNAERSLRLIIKSINGLTPYDPETRSLNPRYFDVLRAFQVLQDEQALGVRREQTESGAVRTFLYIRDIQADAVIEQAVAVITSSLRLASEDESGAVEDRGVEVIFGPYLGDSRTIRLQTMSILDILAEMGAYIRAPEQHIVEGRTRPNREYDESNELLRPPLRVMASPNEPEDAVVKTRNRDYWFYLDDRDIDSKKAFSFLMILLQLSSANERDRGPVVTIGTN